MKIKNKIYCVIGLALCCSLSFQIQAAQGKVIYTHQVKKPDVFIAVDTRVEQFFLVLSDKLDKPFILSNAVKKERVTGNFDISSPEEAFELMVKRLSLLYFNDGKSIYIYESSEILQELFQVKNIGLAELKDYLQDVGLYDQRYPLRAGQDQRTFYISGPPVYIKLVKAAAEFLDNDVQEKINENTNNQVPVGSSRYGDEFVQIFPLKNTFVQDRTYTLRGETVVLPGITSVLQQLFIPSKGIERTAVEPHKTLENNDSQKYDEAVNGIEETNAPIITKIGQYNVELVPLPGSNSLLVKTSREGLALIDSLISQLDKPKRQVELSLWIIDISKNKADSLGVNWQASYDSGKGSFFFNTASLSAASGFNFLGKIKALSEDGEAQMVSRPMLLTQENTPAIFDNNTTFYTQIKGERVASLESTTFGTMISVLPRIGNSSKDIEMIINLEDGAEKKDDNGDDESVEKLPVINRTNISTVARVSEGGSLLIGGYTREDNVKAETKVPFLSAIPLVGRAFKYESDNNKKMIRIFMLQPRLLENTDAEDFGSLIENPFQPIDKKTSQALKQLQAFMR
ncbi:type III secretion system outer membrane ring subunit SctC [Proteus sp. WDL240414]|uniref:Type 3 secretion system secretin n=2 Tax=Proteus TaxID=583 RepID=A0A6I7D4N9_9GAMM|nr:MULTISPECIES: type III secretion system outer membrane ring subunit SctC [Proteus]MBG2802472.1 type III secretion system outer membrane ring subunit SctC [Proteus mirabilis]MBG3151063.1 type III secretion system outer membrane ring subunit SctC [Proteus mirabilis]QHN12031.1 EscC/YscC/HrcC family type III secretion system outer membrane ring protein [Proteus columbae]